VNALTDAVIVSGDHADKIGDGDFVPV